MALINGKKHQKSDQFVTKYELDSYISQHSKANFGVLEILIFIVHLHMKILLQFTLILNTAGPRVLHKSKCDLLNILQVL